MPLFYVNPAPTTKTRSTKRYIPKKGAASRGRPTGRGRPPGVPHTPTKRNPGGRGMPKTKGVRYKGKVVHGAVANRIRAKRAAAKRRAAARKRKNPARPKSFGKKQKGGMLGQAKRRRAKRKTKGYRPSPKTVARRKAARKKHAAAPKRKPHTAMTTTKEKRASSKRKSPKRVAAAKKAAATRRRKAAARSKAAKKAARTRKMGRRKPVAAKTTRRRKPVARRRRKKLTKKQRSRIARRAARASARARARKSYRRTKRSHRKMLRTKRRTRKWKGKNRVAKSLPRARHTIKYQRAYGSPRSKAFMKRFGMRSNVGGGVIDAVKKALPIAISMYGTRAVSRQIVPRIPGLGSLGKHAAPAGAGLMLLAATFLTKKVAKLNKYREQILLGAGLNFIDVCVATYRPPIISDLIGLSGDGIYDSALGEYMQVGEYIDTSGYMSEMGEYLEIGAEEQLGAFEELGMMQELGEENIGTGIGTQNAAMLKSVGSRAMTAPVPSRSFVREVPHVGAGYDKLANLYTGIFAGGLK